jgi:hypothetical protein
MSRATWFETREDALLTMRVENCRWASGSVPTIEIVRLGMNGGHGAIAPLPTLQRYEVTRLADTKPHTAITAMASEISTL